MNSKHSRLCFNVCYLQTNFNVGEIIFSLLQMSLTILNSISTMAVRIGTYLTPEALATILGSRNKFVSIKNLRSV